MECQYKEGNIKQEKQGQAKRGKIHINSDIGCTLKLHCSRYVQKSGKEREREVNGGVQKKS